MVGLLITKLRQVYAESVGEIFFKSVNSFAKLQAGTWLVVSCSLCAWLTAYCVDLPVSRITWASAVLCGKG